MTKETTKKAEKIARRIAKEKGQPESLWELFLAEAYREIMTKEQ